MSACFSSKLLLCLPALAAAAPSAVAQSNVVASFNIPIPANHYVMIANPLNTTNNTIANLLRDSSDGATFYKWSDGGGFRAYTYDALLPGWDVGGDVTLSPGEGGFYMSPIATTLTFVGEILQGRLTNTLPIGQYVIRSAMVPQAGTPSALGIPGEDGDILQLYHGSNSAYVYDSLVPGWVPSEPTIGVGEPFWYKKAWASKTNQWILEYWPVIRITDAGLGLNGGNLGFNATGPPGLLFVIEASTDFLNWVSLLTNSMPAGSYDFTDPTSATLPTRFYRLRSP
jgi:hypothetical protein